ncbi:NAD-dependent epimerase/dehydratase [Paenibacillus vortex V453]|uniref:NAD-dependent epimerase/dehydratase n=1 Tax=Paenibacillus vortex V453 TaxID=715225 RepID=A0A2R9STM6_9BACL|nr:MULTISPECIES: SDR family oxidoreductase [Paenibacillus]MCA4752254.1 SDR family oxidoreductase [Mycolicibacterium fortuitum]AVV58364.1 NAD-dependent dehydratase [Paenibacillus glucanolyticus]AWP27525.1 NAD-dependent dehydratase [Paenibacillus sp. Cedars]EFU40714.1 NAD-dependent epimerase/dehydratase [Paenibacillus vortex V453]ETT42581.1 NAD-dependent epimerase/dehydratase [Paenibacillus sp. FSL R5-808]
MTSILILGAGGQIADQAIDLFLQETDVQLTLYLRNANRLKKYESNRARLVEGDVLDHTTLRESMEGQDAVYANLSGDDLEDQAKAIVDAMESTGVKRLIFISSLGIYDEVPGDFGKWNNRTIGEYLGPYRKSVDVIEASNLDYTVLRPAWLTDYDEIEYEVTEKGEPFKGTEVSRKSVAALVVKLIESSDLHVRGNLGVNKPNTDGEKPAFY